MSFRKLATVGLLAISLSASANAQNDTDNVTFLNPPGSKTPFSEAVQVNETLFLSGQLGLNPKTHKLAVGGMAAETKQALTNIKNVLSRNNYTMSDVVKCTVILTDMKKFQEFNSIYLETFTAPYPARTTFAVDSLAFNAEIEIECMAAK